MATLPSTMRALVMTKPKGAKSPSLALTTRPLPVPKSGELLVRVHASAIQPSDIYNSRGGFGLTVFPRVPGRDFSGVVVACGDESSAIGIDTPVFGTSGNTIAFVADGFHAEYAVVPVDGVAVKPPAISHIQAATIGVPFSTAALAVHRSGAVKGETALVLGGNGAVGSAASAMLEARGCRVLRAVRGSGGDLDTSADPELKSVRERYVSGGVDVIIDTVGVPALTRAAADEALGLRGRLVFIVAPKTAEEPVLSINMRAFYRFEKSILGVNSAEHGVQTMAGLLAEQSGDIVEKALTGGWDEVTLDEAVDAYNKQGKFVIKIDQE